MSELVAGPWGVETASSLVQIAFGDLEKELGLRSTKFQGTPLETSSCLIFLLFFAYYEKNGKICKIREKWCL